MKIIKHETYVSHEIAELLKEAGFNWKCINKYIKNTDLIVSSLKEANWNDTKYEINNYKSAPTLEIAQKWLREIKNIDIYIFPTINTKIKRVYQVGIKPFDRTLYIYRQLSTSQYNIYEEAQEAGVKKALEIILKKEKIIVNV